MCICENAEKAKIPKEHAGILKNKYGYFFVFCLEEKTQNEKAVPIKYCPYCGKELK